MISIVSFEDTEVFNFKGAFRGLRNPHESWSESDSVFVDNETFKLGKKDIALAQRLIKGGSEERKFLRQIFVCTDFIAPAYFMAELDTYKVGVVRNSTSFMHKGASRLFKLEDFCIEEADACTKLNIDYLNELRKKYLETKDYKYFRLIRQQLPQGYLYRSTITMNYENVFNMVQQRKFHRLTEWSHDFVKWAHTLPYANQLIFFEDQNEVKL